MVFDKKDDKRIMYPIKGIFNISQAKVPIIKTGLALQQKKSIFWASTEVILLLKYKSDVIFAPRGYPESRPKTYAVIPCGFVLKSFSKHKERK